MSWSLHAEGTKEAVKRDLAARNPPTGFGEEEVALFESVRTAMINFADHAPEVDGSLTIVRASGGGHGQTISGLQFETRIVSK